MGKRETLRHSLETLINDEQVWLLFASFESKLGALFGCLPLGICDYFL